MDPKPIEAQFKAFFLKARDELVRAGEDLRQEAERLLTEVKDPKTQAKVRESLDELGQWAKKAAEDVADAVELGIHKAEQVIRAKAPGKKAASRKKAAPKGRKRTRRAKATKK